ncbi:hypothetical protein [Dickeya dianthicola]|nr:hypothetical protein [Dickeya dianthicola]MCI4002640.1 hypothetical protein [Dickeya dianthicola]MCI4029201.1 hypothetical protein [Dickeya dianthicola]MCI4113733.1 hypothetical protein [Dickeya dianthicola]MCI4118283.1 hypothetical protein [Dickeya dianthicola]MCI4123644.1 hypothetical protein [Dickeya dianthicola]
MPTYLDPRSILHRRFASPASMPRQAISPAQEYYWHSYATRFFASNGLDWHERMANLQCSSRTSDLTSFINMIGQLLPVYRARNDLSHIDSVLMAHWTPDLHLGSSVINYVIESLRLPACLALTISDRGPDAALFALSSIANCQQEDNHDSLLLIADQSNLPYHSTLLESLAPENNACLFSVSCHEQPLRYRGFCRRPQPTADTLAPTVAQLCQHFALRQDRLCVVAEPLLLAALPPTLTGIVANPHLVCAAPFVALAEHYQPGRDYLLLVHYQDTLSAVALQGLE